MKNLVLILAILMAVSCTSSRNVQKSSSAADSSVIRKENSTTKSNQSLSVETKNVFIVKDSVTTKADSAKTNFTFNTADSASDDIVIDLETGTLKAKAKFNKKTGIGTLEALKKPEEVFVNKYQEQTYKGNFVKNDSAWKNVLDSSALHRTATGKNTERKTSYTLLILSGSVVLLLLLVGLYFWLRN